jgi:hypothetical protein
VGFPTNPVDGEQIIDAFGNIFQYNEEEDSWINLGQLQDPDAVTERRDGLIFPPVFGKLEEIEDLIEAGVSFDRFKLADSNNYFYYFRSTDDSIRFKPELTISGEKKLRIEVDKGRILQKLTRTPCIGPKGATGATGDDGRDGDPAPNEEFQDPSSLTGDDFEFSAIVPTPIDTDISIRLFLEREQMIEILFPLGSGPTEVIAEEGFEVDLEQTEISYNPSEELLTGKVVLEEQ